MSYDPLYNPSGTINYTSQYGGGFTTPTQFGSGNYTMASTPQQMSSYQAPSGGFGAAGGGAAGSM